MKFNLSLSDEAADDNQLFKFNLYLMTREIQQISSALQNVTLLPEKKQQAWVQDNQELLQGFMKKLSHEMFEVLDEMSLDQTALAETIICVTQARDLVNTLSSLMNNKKLQKMV